MDLVNDLTSREDHFHQIHFFGDLRTFPEESDPGSGSQSAPWREPLFQESRVHQVPIRPERALEGGETEAAWEQGLIGHDANALLSSNMVQWQFLRDEDKRLHFLISALRPLRPELGKGSSGWWRVSLGSVVGRHGLLSCNWWERVPWKMRCYCWDVCRNQELLHNVWDYLSQPHIIRLPAFLTSPSTCTSSYLSFVWEDKRRRRRWGPIRRNQSGTPGPAFRGTGPTTTIRTFQIRPRCTHSISTPRTAAAGTATSRNGFFIQIKNPRLNSPWFSPKN